MELLGPEMGNYVVVTMVETDVKPGTPAGGINGGFFLKSTEAPGEGPG